MDGTRSCRTRLAPEPSQASHTRNNAGPWYIFLRLPQNYVTNVYLVNIMGKSNIVMNYLNYKTLIVQGWGVKLVGWPDGISFVNPSHLGMVSDLWRIHDALKSKTCYWTVLTAKEREDHRAELQALCSPVRVKVGVKDNQTTNTQVTAIMRDVGLRNYGEFNELFFCNEAVLWAVDENGWALLACRSV